MILAGYVEKSERENLGVTLEERQELSPPLPRQPRVEGLAEAASAQTQSLETPLAPASFLKDLWSWGLGGGKEPRKGEQRLAPGLRMRTAMRVAEEGASSGVCLGEAGEQRVRGQLGAKSQL